MRIRSDMFVSALSRRVFASGGFAAVEHKGAQEAGAIFIRQRFRDGTETLFGPAPQNFLEDEGRAMERCFERHLAHADPDLVTERLARELRFDRDLWVLELETDEITDLISVVDTD